MRVFERGDSHLFRGHSNGGVRWVIVKERSLPNSKHT
jgi:hypothetical protein